MNQPKTDTKKKHLILGHPILWCLLALPLTMVLSQLFIVVPRLLLENLMQPGDLRSLLDTILGGLCYVLAGYGLVKIAQKAYGESFRVGFTGNRLRESLLLSLPGLMMVISNIIPAFTDGPWRAPGALPLLDAILSAVTVGLAEELCSRNFVMENAMQCLRTKKNGMFFALLLSAVGFGALHLLNLTNDQNDTTMVLIQVFSAMVMGLFFGAIYLRTRNLWGAVLMHALVDISSFCINSAEQTTAPTIGLILNYVVLSLILVAISVYMLRKSKWADMRILWEIPQPAEADRA